MFQVSVEVTEHEVLIDLLRAIQSACPTLLIRIAHVGANVSAAGAAEGGAGQRSAPDTAPTPAFSPIRVTAQQPTRVEPVAAHLAHVAQRD